MRFLNPVAIICLRCGQPTVAAETSIGSVQVHCGTWRWECDLPATVTVRTDSLSTDRYAVPPPGSDPLDPAGAQRRAA